MKTIIADLRSHFKLRSGWVGFLVLIILAGAVAPVLGGQPATIWCGESCRHAVALTFDDGPSPLYTPEILALLKQYQAHATFFVMGSKVEKSPWLVRAMLQEGHEVGNHSFSHPRLTATDQPSREWELEATSLNLDLVGCPRKHRLIRPPYSAFDNRLISYAAHTGRELVLWSLDSGDWKGLDQAAIVKNVLTGVHNGSIIIFHDSDEKSQADRRATVEALKVILPVLRAAGYRMVTVSELVNAPAR
jgi:peptidoglycan/xylan/chitin deacetylase (PgdA/CDA1 family)